MDVASPLTCLWADLLNKDAEMSPKDVLLLIQRALVLVGSTFHAINMEWRIAWSRLQGSGRIRVATAIKSVHKIFDRAP